MDDDKIIYLIIRIYLDSERQSPSLYGTDRFYAWTYNKKLVKAFLDQRNKNKYRVLKIPFNEVPPKYQDELFDNNRLDVAPLRSIKNKDNSIVYFISTMDEIIESKIKIHRIFHDLCLLSKMKFNNKRSLDYYLEMIASLKSKYFHALDYIGYRPRELMDKYDRIHEDTIDGIADEISIYYDRHIETHHQKSLKPIPMKLYFDDVSKEIFYSLEAFVKVLRHELE